MHLHHQFRRVRFAVAEELLEHIGHVRHQVHRVVPDDRHPGDVRRGVLDDVLVLARSRSCLRRRHHAVENTGDAVLVRSRADPIRLAGDFVDERACRFGPRPAGRAADRQVRTDDAGGGTARRHRPPPRDLRGVRPSPARGPALRRDRGYRPPPGSVAALQVRRRRTRSGVGFLRRRDDALPGRLPVHRRRGRLSRGRVVLPGLAGAVGARQLRRVRGSRDARAVDVQLRLRGGVRRRADGRCGGWAPADRDGLAARSRAGRGRRRAGRLPRRFHRVVEPGGAAPARGAGAGHQCARVHPAAHRGRSTAVRLGARRVPRPGRRAGCGNHAAGRHLRHHRRRRQRRRRGGPAAGRGPDRFRRPGHARRPGPRATRRPGRHLYPHRRLR